MTVKAIEGSITNTYLNKPRIKKTEDYRRIDTGDTTLLGTGRDRDAGQGCQGGEWLHDMAKEGRT